MIQANDLRLATLAAIVRMDGTSKNEGNLSMVGTCSDCGETARLDSDLCSECKKEQKDPERKTFCDACGEETSEKSFRTWACDGRCYAEIQGIGDHEY